MKDHETVGSQKPAMTFLLDFMRAHPQATYAEAAEAARREGHTIYPINWGRAQLMLGRITRKPREAKEPRESARRGGGDGAEAPRRGPGRPRKVLDAGAGGPLRIALPVDGPDDLARWQLLLDRLNGGARFVLQYANGDWVLVEAG